MNNAILAERFSAMLKIIVADALRSVPGLLEAGRTCYEKGPKRSRSCRRMEDLARSR